MFSTEQSTSRSASRFAEMGGDPQKPVRDGREAKRPTRSDLLPNKNACLNRPTYWSQHKRMAQPSASRANGSARE
jgi:hypothetical protein